MNLILLSQSDFLTKTTVRLTDRRFNHIQSILKSKPDDKLSVGQLNGAIGEGKVLNITDQGVELAVTLHKSAPQPLPLTLIVPMIRPPMFKRLLFHATTLGIKKIIVLNFNRVEKGLWNSSSLRPQEIQEQLLLGLEQAKDTILPEVTIEQRFKPFIEDKLPALAEGTLKLVAHPGGKPCPTQMKQAITLLIGPEGGLVDFEVEQLTKAGFIPIDLGPRILRVDTALPYIIGKLF